MTDSSSDSGPEYASARYGQSTRSALPRRLLAIGLGALGIATAAAVAVVGYQRLTTAEVTGKMFGYQVIDNHTASVTISVTRSEPSRPVVCIVRVRAADGSETGRREIVVPPSTSSTVQVTTVLESAQPPVVGDVYGCGTDIPRYLRSS